MRKWGVVVTAYYALVLIGLVTPGLVVFLRSWDEVATLFANLTARWPQFAHQILELYAYWPYWILIGLFVGGQALLLFLSVDTSWRRTKPRRHVVVSIVYISVLFGLLTVGTMYSLIAAIFGDDGGKFFDYPLRVLAIEWGSGGTWILAETLAIWLISWLIWAMLFYRYLRGSPDPVARLIAWLLKGSVLELLIAVPCHIAVRQRGDCSAPIATGFGIATGIAIMLLAFGPSVMFLFRKRFDRYRSRKTGT